LTNQSIQLAGKALIWQVIQMSGVKAIFLVRIIVLAHLLAPADFGLIAIATTAMGFLVNITDFGIIPALVQGEKMDDDHYNAAWTIGITRSTLIAIVMVIAAPLIADLFAEPNSVSILQVMALNPILEALTSIKVAALNRNLLFRPLAVLQLANASINTVTSIALAMFFGVWGLIGGTLAGTATAAVFSYILAPHHPRLSFNLKPIQPLLRFGRWIFATSLIAMAGGYFLRIAISRQIGVSELGVYYLASQLAFLTGEIASEVVGNVAFPLFSRLQNDIARATRVFRVMFTSLIALLYPVCALIIVLAPGLVKDILGTGWRGTEPVIRILAFSAMIGILGETAVPVLKGFGQPHRITLLELIQSSTLIALGWIFTRQFGLVGAAFAWLPAISFSQLLNIRFINQILDRPFSGLGRSVWTVLMITVTSATIAGLVYSLISGTVGVIIAIVLAALVTGSLLWISDRRLSLGFVRNLAWIFPQVAAFLGAKSTDN
jgi:O-antigen/teichoic acid export membrane protein